MHTAALVLADFDLMNIAWWLIVGLVAGALASMVMRGGYGIVGDIIVGLVGALIGGFLANLLGFSGSGGIVWTIVVTFIGACVLIAVLRLFSGGYRRA